MVSLNGKCGDIRDKNDHLLTKDADILKRWREYGMGLYDANTPTDW